MRHYNPTPPEAHGWGHFPRAQQPAEATTTMSEGQASCAARTTGATPETGAIFRPLRRSVKNRAAGPAMRGRTPLIGTSQGRCMSAWRNVKTQSVAGMIGTSVGRLPIAVDKPIPSQLRLRKILHRVREISSPDLKPVAGSYPAALTNLTAMGKVNTSGEAFARLRQSVANRIATCVWPTLNKLCHDYLLPSFTFTLGGVEGHAAATRIGSDTISSPRDVKPDSRYQARPECDLFRTPAANNGKRTVLLRRAVVKPPRPQRGSGECGSIVARGYTTRAALPPSESRWARRSVRGCFNRLAVSQWTRTAGNTTY